MSTIEEARDYVRTTPLSGLAQLALVRRAGFPDYEASLLEIGCGALHFAKAFLVSERKALYCGMDPNEWLRDAARDDDTILDVLCDGANASFSDRADFDGATAFERKFDMVFAHSVLSHIGLDQLGAFFDGAARALWSGGTLLASVNIARPFEVPTIGHEWTYPAGVTIDEDEIYDAAREAGLACSNRPELRAYYTSWCPDETHDWIVATKH